MTLLYEETDETDREGRRLAVSDPEKLVMLSPVTGVAPKEAEDSEGTSDIRAG